MHILLII
jgi:hypothetical protein